MCAIIEEAHLSSTMCLRVSGESSRGGVFAPMGIRGAAIAFPSLSPSRPFAIHDYSRDAD